MRRWSYRAGGCSAHRPRSKTGLAFHCSWLPQGLLYQADELLHAKRFFDTGGSALFQQGDGIAVRKVPGDEDEARAKLRAMAENPGMDVGAIHPARRADVRNHPSEMAGGQQLESFRPGR